VAAAAASARGSTVQWALQMTNPLEGSPGEDINLIHALLSLWNHDSELGTQIGVWSSQKDA
jgi:hypothetical protein